jgi:DNA-binding beta-propeller fold protein YncE
MKRCSVVALLAIVLAGVMIPAAAGAQAPAFLYKWGMFGAGNGQFYYPSGIVVDGGGSVYVADYMNARVQKFTSNGTYLTQWGVGGGWPNGLAVDGSGNVYATCDAPQFAAQQDVLMLDENGGSNTVQKFTSSGSYLAQWGTEGSGDGQFGYPTGVAVDASGNVYVADQGNCRIQKFTSDGAYVTQWGTLGSGDGQFRYPYGVAVDASGNVCVADYVNHRIQKFTSSGSYLTQWGTLGSGDGQFNLPSGVAVDGGGNVYVADYYNHRIQAFTGSGVYITQWGTLGSGNGQFRYPHSVAVDASGNVYVADQYNHRIQVFGSLPVPAQSTTWGRIKALYR